MDREVVHPRRSFIMCLWPYEFGGRFLLPRGLSYPLKRSILDAALTVETAELLGSVAYMKAPTLHGEAADLVMKADYIGPSERGVDGITAGHEGATLLRLYAVPSPARREVETALAKQALPQLHDWLISLHADPRRRDHSHCIRWCWSEGQLSAERV